MNTQPLKIALILGSAWLLASTVAFAQGTASSPSTVHEVDPSTNTVWIGGPNDLINGPAPYPIDLDASGGPWRKQIYSGPIAGSGGGILFRETILNAGTEPWTDWHEINVNLGSQVGIWGTSSVTDLRINGTSIGFTTSVTGTMILDVDSFSQPVLPGDVLEIDKQFALTTALFSPPNTLLYTLLEFPTSTIPEPTTLVLLAVCGVALSGTRRR
ncbi:PEP-CTERM sorting domain-containing protein [Adhaeretor mobilis]|uniref:PEP-CTERM protein-sorting domain-containing protein n=1 Tax=Adhaeretor mobilis TaxID=1930276 RepID=A0A517MT54_9BACT|nr:PEP-CTERM sorting domain-containing protein [Adhaeretor mobilis]QDS98066.1 hypothetical protein HG15A2_13380 [Adhaeretor mobilis]